MSDGDTRKAWIQERINKGLCVECGIPVAPETTKRCMSCRERQRISAKKYRQGVGRELHQEAVSRWQKENPERCRELVKKSNKKLKDEIFDHYGRVCACCGETTFGFLTIDHINNDGSKHRKVISKGRNVSANTYRWLRQNNYPDGFQTLCFNCNQAKAIYGKCPHQQ